MQPVPLIFVVKRVSLLNAQVADKSHLNSIADWIVDVVANPAFCGVYGQGLPNTNSYLHHSQIQWYKFMYRILFSPFAICWVEVLFFVKPSLSRNISSTFGKATSLQNCRQSVDCASPSWAERGPCGVFFCVVWVQWLRYVLSTRHFHGYLFLDNSIRGHSRIQLSFKVDTLEWGWSWNISGVSFV